MPNRPARITDNDVHGFLLPGGHYPRPRGQRMIQWIKDLQSEGPYWIHSLKFFLFGSRFNVLLMFVPLSIISSKLGWPPPLRFVFSFIAIIALSRLLRVAADQVSARLGEKWGELFNAGIGSVAEIIVQIVALIHDEFRIVQTSIIGSIFSKILLTLGCSFVAGGLRFPEACFPRTATQASTCLMTLTCFTLVIPAVYHSDPLLANNNTGLFVISRGTAILLLCVYAAHLYFQMWSHVYLSVDPAEEEEEEPPVRMNAISAFVSLLGVTAIISSCAEFLVVSLEDTANTFHIPKVFIGLILLPIVGNPAEQADLITAVRMARIKKYTLTVSMCTGSSIRVIAFIGPVLVIIGWITGHQLTLAFSNFEIITLVMSVLLVSFVLIEGRSHYMQGLILLVLYGVIGIATWMS